MAYFGEAADVRQRWTLPSRSPILSDMNDAPKPRRRWLRLLLVPILLISVWMGWDVVKMKSRLRKQQEAVAVVKDLGGTVEDRIGKGEFPPPPEPFWLRALMGPEALPCIVGVWLNGPKVTDAEIEKLKGLTELRFVNLANTQVTDGGLSISERTSPAPTIVFLQHADHWCWAGRPRRTNPTRNAILRPMSSYG